MTERSLELEQEFGTLLSSSYRGVLDRLRSYYPKAKITLRGSEVKLQGEASEMDKLETMIELMFEFYQRFGSLTEGDVSFIVEDTDAARANLQDEQGDSIVYGNEGKVIKARTIHQRELAEAAKSSDLLFAIGPAGTGKTYTAIALAVAAYKAKTIKKIILSRPAVEAGEKLGFLPGDLRDKLDPYLQPLYDALRDMLPPRKLQDLLEAGIIQIIPLAYMRGRTLDNAFVILDEAQNATYPQLKMFLTRMGRNAKFIITGDLSQIDLSSRDMSGLHKVIKTLRPVSGINFVEFDKRDIVRHPLVKAMVDAFEKSEYNEKHINGSIN